MIFLDETGKRWRAVKRAVLTSGLVMTVPVVVLAAGAYILNPGWAALHLRPFEEPKPAAPVTSAESNAVVLGSSTTASRNLALFTAKPAPATAPTKTAPATTNTGTSSSQAPAPTPSPVPTSSGTQSTHTPTANAKTTDPGKSSSGLSHHFTTL